MKHFVHKFSRSVISRMPIKAFSSKRFKIFQVRAVATLTQQEIKKKVKMGCSAVQRASLLCRHVQRSLKTNDEVDKADDSPVTVADFAAQAIVAWSLQNDLPTSTPLSLVAEETSDAIKGENFRKMRERITQLVNSFTPEEVIFSEEDVLDLIDLGNSNGGSNGEHWVLDPIDGTRGFVSNRQYSICLGLLHNGQPVLGVLGCPNLPEKKLVEQDGIPDGTSGGGCMFLGVKNEAAYVGSLWEEAMPSSIITVEKHITVEQVRFMESFESRHSNHQWTDTLAKNLGIQRAPLRLDSQAKYGALSRGDAELFMRFPPKGYREKIWDHCAGAVIVEAAGGKISDGFGNALDFSKGRFLDIQCGIVAAPPELHSQVTSLIKSGILLDS